jgi:uncharacterized protein (TIGR02217 family)
MSNIQFPALQGLTWSVFKTPQWNTKIQTATSGRELRSAWFSTPKYGFKLSYEILRAATAYSELQTLMGFFNARQGSFDNFLYDDPTDDAVTAQPMGIGNGTQTVFPLVRTLGAHTEPVMNVNAITGIYINGTAATACTVDGQGNVTFATAPAAGAAITWSGSYFYRCRFVRDSNEFENFMYQLWRLKEIEFIGSLGNKV